MMTWVSDRSGIASRGTRSRHQMAPATATAVRTRTTNRLRADSSMIRSIMSVLAGAVGGRSRGLGGGRLRGALRRPARRRERGFQPRLGIHEEVRRGEDLLPFPEARE